MYSRGWWIVLYHKASVTLGLKYWFVQSLVVSWVLDQLYISFIIIKQHSSYCVISDDMQTVSELTNSRNNCTNVNHTGSFVCSLRSCCTAATSVTGYHKRSHTSMYCLTEDRGRVPMLLICGQVSSFLEQDLHV